MNFQKTQPNSSALCHKQVAKEYIGKTHSIFQDKRFSLYLVPSTLLLLSLLFFIPSVSFAKDPTNITDLLKLEKAPAGVVIEIVTWGGDNLQWALPQSKKYISKLRKKFPKLAVAIVTHGAEQFALTKDEEKDNKEVHQLVQSFGNDDVPVHVCETFAGWRGLTADDFPSYVNVAAAGPAQVNDYIALGYELIVIKDED